MISNIQTTIAHFYSNRTRDNKGLLVLDGLRGATAVYVVMGHAIWLLTAPPGLREGRTWWMWIQIILAGMFRYGHAAVICFFILSGLVLHLRLAKARQQNQVNFDYFTYIKRRIARIYPPLAAALIVTFLLDAIGRQINPAFYNGVASQIGLGEVIRQFDYSWPTFIGNFVFLQGIAIPAYGSNGPLWSLAIEGLIYIIYPLVFVPLYTRFGPKPAFLISGGVGFISFLLWFATESAVWSIASYFTIWLFGALIAEAYVTDWHWSSKINLMGISGCGLVLLALLYGKLPTGISEASWGFAISLTILALIQAKQDRLTSIITRTLERLQLLAPSSYTLYLLHFPILFFLAALYLEWQGSLAVDYGWVFIGALVCIGVAFLVAPRLETIGRNNL